MTMSESEFLKTAKRAAHIGGQIAVDRFASGFSTQGKSSGGQFNTHELVTEADIESERAIVETIRAAFPDHAILAEEFHEADLDSPNLWVVDPLDGTNNFAHGVPHWAVSIAFYENGAPQCAVVFNPVRGDLFVAERGGGATRNGEPIQVDPSRSLTEVLVAVGFFYDRGEMMERTLDAVRDLFRARIHGIRRFGTASLDLCQVAMGWYGGYFEYELAPWDFAAGRLIVEEAGGQVTNCRGNELQLGRSSILATNSHIHEAIHSIIEPHFPSSLAHD